ncbi:MAG: phosphatidate cytidylyltransferase, partial [Rhodanobacter sp.]
MLLQRVLTALVLVPLALLIILLPDTAVFALICAATFLGALWEWSQLGGLKSLMARGMLLIVAAVIFALLWQWHATVLTPLLLVAGVIWWLLACLWLRHFAFAAAPTGENRALKLLAGALVIFPAWIALLAIHGRVPHGHWWTLLALVIVWCADIGAYFSGRAFGKR